MIVRVLQVIIPVRIASVNDWLDTNVLILCAGRMASVYDWLGTNGLILPLANWLGGDSASH